MGVERNGMAHANLALLTWT